MSFYFYHLLPKSTELNSKGLLSLEYMYNNNIKLFNKNSFKYRDRLCNGWGIYQNKNPNELTSKEVHDGINKFRQSTDGCNQIYFFKFPPYQGLGTNMKNVLSYKKIIRIDLDDKLTKSYIKDIDWGYYMSYTGNAHLTEDYYRNISEEEYFKNYDDTNKMLFAPINHISIIPKKDYLPLHILEIMNV